MQRTGAYKACEISFTHRVKTTNVQCRILYIKECYVWGWALVHGFLGIICRNFIIFTITAILKTVKTLKKKYCFTNKKYTCFNLGKYKCKNIPFINISGFWKARNICRVLPPKRRPIALLPVERLSSWKIYSYFVTMHTFL